MKYRCRILFTTRSSFNNYTFMNLEEIGDTDALIKLMGCFYSDAEKNRTIWSKSSKQYTVILLL